MAVADTLDVESAQWLDELRSSGRRQVDAVDRLHAMLLRVARAEVHRRAATSPVPGPELDDIAHQATADALVAIMTKLSQFRGESRFTTWAYRFVVLEVSSKLGRHFWRHPVARMDSADWEQLPDRFGVDPADHAQGRELLGAVLAAVDEALTDRQRRVFVALVVHRVPLDALVVELGTNRNALYKMMFDARRKVRAHLVADGYLDGGGSEVGT